MMFYNQLEKFKMNYKSAINEISDVRINGIDDITGGKENAA